MNKVDCYCCYLCTVIRYVRCICTQTIQMCSVPVYRATSAVYLCTDTRNVQCPHVQSHKKWAVYLCMEPLVQCTALEMCHVPVYRAKKCAVYLCTEPLVQCTHVQIPGMCHGPVYKATRNVQHTWIQTLFACAMYLCTEPLDTHSVPVNITPRCAQYTCAHNH